MILAVLGLGGIGLWFVIAGDGPARIVGLAVIAMAGLFGFLLWVAVAVERPAASIPWPNEPEVTHG
jgi:cation transporter-like permease